MWAALGDVQLLHTGLPPSSLLITPAHRCLQARVAPNFIPLGPFSSHLTLYLHDIDAQLFSFFQGFASFPSDSVTHTGARTKTYRCHVDGGRGLIHDEDAALPHKRSGETEELPLTLAEVLSSLRHRGVCRGGRGVRVCRNSTSPRHLRIHSTYVPKVFLINSWYWSNYSICFAGCSFTFSFSKQTCFFEQKCMFCDKHNKKKSCFVEII